MASTKTEIIISKECQVVIGDFCLLLVYEPYLDPYFQEYYAGCSWDWRKPDLVIELEVVRHPVGAYGSPPALAMVKEVKENHFSFGSGLLEGTLHLEEKLCKVTIKEALLYGGGYKAFESLLLQVYYTLLHYQDPPITSFLVHASGVVRDGRGFVFSGPSGCGKTTIASLSSQETVLNDDVIIVEKRNANFWIRSTPLSNRFPNRQAGEAPLKAIFLPEHARENWLKQLDKADFIARFIREVIFSAPLLSTDKRSSFLQMMDFAALLAEEVSTYQLGFRRDRGFWECIQKEGLL